MSLIIAATDFSPIAENAVHYSCNLALAKNASLLVLHTFTFPVMYSDMPFPASLIEDTQEDAEGKMSALIERLHSIYPNLNIESKVAYGNVIDIIDEYCEHTAPPWLVIIGNSNGEENSAWFESTLNELSTGLNYPLLAVPPQYAYRPVLKICYAFDNDIKGQDIALAQIKNVTRTFNAELNVFYASKDGLNRDNVAELDTKAKEMLADVNPHYHYEYGVKIDNAIIDFARNNHIDWLAVMPRKHSFFEGLFHNSHTKNIAQHANMPILLLHEK